MNRIKKTYFIEYVGRLSNEKSTGKINAYSEKEALIKWKENCLCSDEPKVIKSENAGESERVFKQNKRTKKAINGQTNFGFD